jgi:hypothetical protein
LYVYFSPAELHLIQVINGRGSDVIIVDRKGVQSYRDCKGVSHPRVAGIPILLVIDLQM